MRESSPNSNQYDNDSTPGAPRRAPLPLPRMEVPAPAPVPEQPPREAPRAPVVLFDRSAFETEVTAPAMPQPEQIQPEAFKPLEEAEDDDAAPTKPADRTAPQPAETSAAEAPAPTPVQAVEIQPEPVAEAEPWPQAQSAQQPVRPPAQTPAPEANFEGIMRDAGMSQEFIDATSDEKPAEYQPSYGPVEAGSATEAENPAEELNDDTHAAMQPPPAAPRMAYSQQAQPFGPNYKPAAFMNQNTAPPAPTPPTPATGGGGGGGGTTPPVGYGGGAPSGPGGGPNPNIPATQGGYLPNYNAAPMPSPLDIVNDQLNRRAHQRGLRKGFVVGGAAGWFTGRHFAKKKFRKQEAAMRQEFGDQLAAQDARHEQAIKGLEDPLDVKDVITGRIAKAPEAAPERPLTERRVEQPAPAARPFGEAAPAGAKTTEAVTPTAPEAAQAVPASEEQSSDPFVHQKEQQPDHKVRAEWIDFDVDKYGHTVQREYGRAYQEEISQERAGSQQYANDPGQPAGATGNQGQGAGVGASLGGFAGGGAGYSSQQHPQQLGSGQVAPQYGLPDGHEYLPDEQHRLPQPKKQVVSNIANPLFWLMLGIIVAAFFVAALI